VSVGQSLTDEAKLRGLGTMKIVKTEIVVEGITKNGFPGCDPVAEIYVENQNDQYEGCFIVGLNGKGQVERSIGLRDANLNLTDNQIKRALKGEVETTKSSGWWLD
jgi:hypothetical protein